VGVFTPIFGVGCFFYVFSLNPNSSRYDSLAGMFFFFLFFLCGFGWCVVLSSFMEFVSRAHSIALRVSGKWLYEENSSDAASGFHCSKPPFFARRFYTPKSQEEFPARRGWATPVRSDV